MAAHSTTPRDTVRAANLENPAVINVRRPRMAEHVHSTVHPTELPRNEDLRQLQTMLRLPDLAATARSWRGPQVRLGAIAQWAAIGLGGLLALWLIFGGRPPSTGESSESTNAPTSAPQAPNLQAPAWGPAAPSKNAREPAAPGLPDWNDPNWSTGASAAPAGAPPESIRTARRIEQPGQGAAPRSPTSDAQPLNITVPVQP